MKEKIITILRIITGLLFVFSGVVKCIDPIGGAIKIEDYFVAWNLENIPFGVCLALSVLQNIVEFSAGYMLIVNVGQRVASTLAMLFMCFYTPLTLYIAIANPVSDCGCFGDAVKLTNWQTFGKNLIFLPISIYLFLNRKLYRKRLSLWLKIDILTIGIITGVLISVKGITDEPIIDFRPFSVGTDINASMRIPDDAPMPEYKTTFILQKDGVEKEFDENNYPYEDSTWVYIDSKTEIISEGYTPPIADFTLTDDEGNVLSDHILHSEKEIVLAISPKVEDVDSAHLSVLAYIAEAMTIKDKEMYIATASGSGAQKQVDTKANYNFSYLQADETMLKTITRSNPGIIIIQNGVIIAKYHINHLPIDGFIESPLSTNLTNIVEENARLTILSVIFAMAFVILLLNNYKRRYKNPEE